jgi:cytidyltransferase-like protein
MTEQENPFGFDPKDDVIHQERTQWLDPIVIVSGGFDPVHKGHMALFNAAAKYGKVHVLLNSDEWLARKKGAPFLSFQTREEVLKNMAVIHRVHSVDDLDDSVCNGLLKLRGEYSNTKIFFANGGDRKINTIPEMWFCEDLGIDLLWNIGGEKIDSSSKLLDQYIDNTQLTHLTHRKWGHYEIISSGEGWLTKILTIDAGKSISLQKHTYRSEEWLILEGYGEFVESPFLSKQDFSVTRVYPGLKINIPELTWHWVQNSEKKKPLKILETWFGEELEESDIERKEDEGEIIILE